MLGGQALVGHAGLRVRILFLTPDLPVQSGGAGRRRMLALLRIAAAHHQVDLLSFASPQPPSAALGELDGLCRQVRLVQASGARSAWRRSWSLLFGALPDLALRLESSAYRRSLAEILGVERYDVVQIEGLEMIPYLPMAQALATRAAIIYDAHHAEMALQRSIFQVHFRHPRRWHKALFAFLQWSKLGTYERLMMNEADMVLCVSGADAAKLRGRRVDPELVPNGVDAGRIAYRPPSRERGNILLWAGSLRHANDADAVGWLLSEVLPRVRERLPHVRLRLVGAGIERFRAEGVEAVGDEEDMAGELAAADVFVAPMRMGGGSPFPVLEAMAEGVPVVSTPQGLAGIAAVHERHALIGDTADTLAVAVVRLLEDRPLAGRMASVARLLVEGRYDWAKIALVYLRLLTAARRAARAAR